MSTEFTPPDLASLSISFNGSSKSKSRQKQKVEAPKIHLELLPKRESDGNSFGVKMTINRHPKINDNQRLKIKFYISSSSRIRSASTVTASSVGGDDVEFLANIVSRNVHHFSIRANSHQKSGPIAVQQEFQLFLDERRLSRQQYRIRAEVYIAKTKKKLIRDSNVLRGIPPLSLKHMRDLAEQHAGKCEFVRIEKLYDTLPTGLWEHSEGDYLNKEEIRTLQSNCPIKQCALNAHRLCGKQYDGTYPTKSPIAGSVQIRIDPRHVMDMATVRVFFVDWSCVNTKGIHYTHLLLVDADDEKMLAFCHSPRVGLIELNTSVRVRNGDKRLTHKGNCFFVIDKLTQTAYIRNDVWVYLWSTKDLLKSLFSCHEVGWLDDVRLTYRGNDQGHIERAHHVTCDGCVTCWLRIDDDGASVINGHTADWIREHGRRDECTPEGSQTGEDSNSDGTVDGM